MKRCASGKNLNVPRELVQITADKNIYSKNTSPYPFGSITQTIALRVQTIEFKIRWCWWG
jgi:hypothetical protein